MLLEKMSETKSNQHYFFSILFFLSGLLIFSAFISLDLNGQNNLLGHFGHSLAVVMVDQLFGLSAFFFPAFFIYAGYFGIRGRDRYYFINRSLTYALFFIFIFLINAYLLNFKMFINSPYAGLFPKLFHNIVLHYFGLQGKLSASLGSHLLELTWIALAGFPFFRLLYMRGINPIQKKLIHRSKALLHSVFKKIEQLKKNSRTGDDLALAKPVKKFHSQKLIRRVDSSHFPTMKEEKLFMRLDREQVDALSQREKALQEASPTLEREENPPNSSSYNAEGLFIQTEEKQRASVPLTEDGGYDFDLSTLSHFQSPFPEKKEATQSFVVIDPQKAPTVLNEKKTTYFKEQFSDIRANAALLEYSELSTRDPHFEESIRATAQKLEKTIEEFGIQTKVVSVSTGPVITRYELTLEPGVKIARVVNLSDNIALSLAAPSVRIVAPIPGKGVIGIEIPNEKRQGVRLRDIIESRPFSDTDKSLPIALGKSILGESVVKDIATTPHLLIAGATGSGKSVCVNSIITSLLIKRAPKRSGFL